MKPLALVVDDDEASSASAKIILRKLGLECVSASTPEAFIDAYSDLKPNLCLIDLFIGGSTAGFDLIERVRRHDPTTPLFIVSGHSDRSHVAHALEIGANDYLVKPLDPESLASKLSRYIQRQARSARLPFFSVPQGRMQAIVRFPCRIVEIDELGLSLQGPHLPAKGMVIEVSSPLLAEATQASSRRLRVSRTWVVDGSPEYGVHAEFDPTDPRPLDRRALKVWLKTRRS